jgi:hypothetical protein
MVLVSWMKAVWVPLGAAAAPHALPLPWMPLLGLKVQPTPAPLGLYWKPLPSTGVSKLALTSAAGGATELTACAKVELIDPVLLASPP